MTVPLVTMADGDGNGDNYAFYDDDNIDNADNDDKALL